MSEGDASDSDGSESASDSDRMTLLLRWWLMQNSMSSCKLLMLLWAKTSKTSLAMMISLGRNTASSRNWRWFQKDGHWHGYPSHCNHVWITSTGFWLDVAGKFRPHVLPPQTHLSTSLHEVAKCLTMKLAVYLAKEVAAILRAVLTHETKKLYNDSTVHLLCCNYWVQPIYQELLHSSSRYNATREGERKRPSSGLARVAAYPKPPKQRKPSASGTASVTGLEVLVVRIPYRFGFRPTGPQWCYNSCNRRRIVIVQITRLGWTRRWLLWTFASNGRRHGQTDVCSSRLAIIEMAPGRATSVCEQAPLKLTGYSCQWSSTSLHYLR